MSPKTFSVWGHTASDEDVKTLFATAICMATVFQSPAGLVADNLKSLKWNPPHQDWFCPPDKQLTSNRRCGGLEGEISPPRREIVKVAGMSNLNFYGTGLCLRSRRGIRSSPWRRRPAGRGLGHWIVYEGSWRSRDGGKMLSTTAARTVQVIGGKIALITISLFLFSFCFLLFVLFFSTSLPPFASSGHGRAGGRLGRADWISVGTATLIEIDAVIGTLT